MKVSGAKSQIPGENLPEPQSDVGNVGKASSLASPRSQPSPEGSVVAKTATRFLMVCLGNICRSPLAEGILREKARQAGLHWEIDSAGTNGYHTGEAPHHLSQKVARLNGLDIGTQRARRFTPDDFQHFDKIYAMAGDAAQRGAREKNPPRRQPINDWPSANPPVAGFCDDIRRIAGKKFDPAKVDLLMNEVHPGKDQDVPDPWYGPEPGYHEVYKMISTAADKIIAKYGQPTKIS